ncbi:MAG TPA: hypothetical protein PLJ35_15735 [Anaerolineae bacterium]|nr:hypothetical protein [Anaerolineae bacterium]HOR00262.1 hypothetical protein [Anaerolineae bacterium]HPL29305.1 hypothetical protein [Anaerolineae bacterium]
MTPEKADAEYRRMMQARERAALTRWRALAGSSPAYAGLLARTEALRRDEGWEPVAYLSEEERDALGN